MAYLLNSSYKYNISERTMSSRRVGLKMDKLCSLITITLFFALASTMLISAGDPEILRDFVVPQPRPEQDHPAILHLPSGINPPHTHPRSAELLILLEGVLEVGFVDSTNKLFKQTLQANDLFIFPKGLVHYQLNVKSDSRAVALGVFGNSNAGAVSFPGSVFRSGMSPKVLAKSFKSDESTISKVIKANKMK